ncbi:MAG: transposase [Candidatus Bathyarchaeota archaeon]|nr:transposase [Candidatus Termiticorpusculum sp.]
MRYKEGIDRYQTVLVPKSLDQCIPQNSICRLIDAFTQALDMQKLGYKYVTTNQTGDRPYDPRMMLNLYLYGYLHKIRSSRRLQAETTRNIEVMWLTNQQTPDYETIINFRHDNIVAIKQTFLIFSLMLSDVGLYGKETEVIDGIKFRANNSHKNSYNPTTLKGKIINIDKQITQRLNEQEKNAKQQEEKDVLFNSQKSKELIQQLKDEIVYLEKLLEQVEKEDKS